MATQANDEVDFVVAQGGNQVAASLLWRTAADPERLRAMLGACAVTDGGPPSPEDTLAVRAKLEAVYRQALGAKAVNGVLFFVALFVFLAGTLWPAMAWAWDPMENDLLNGLVQSGVFVVGGICLAAYRRRKMRQTAIEDAMRRTLAEVEDLEAKRARLDALLHAPDARAKQKRKEDEAKERAAPWRLESAAALRARLTETLERPPTPGEALALAVELKEAGIKVYAYRCLDTPMLVLAGLSVLGGLALPLAVPLLGWGGNPSALGMAQALLVLGLGPLFFTIHRQYRERRERVVAAMRRVQGEVEPFAAKARRIPDALAGIDTGWSR